MSKHAQKMDESLVRRDVRRALVGHFNGRGDLPLSKEGVSKLAAELSTRWSMERCRLFVALTREPNRWATKRELSHEVEVSSKAVGALWLGLKQVVIAVDGQDFVPFRPEVEIKFRHSKGDVAGGICLHLCGDEPLSYGDERGITESTRAATTSLVVNYEGASRRQEAIVPSGERAVIANDRAETLRGVSGEQLGLALVKKTGT